MKLRILDLSYNNPTDYDFGLTAGKIIHFIAPSQKPWINELRGSLMPEWFVNHKKFISYGGVCEEVVCVPTISRKKIYDVFYYGGRVISLLPYLDILKKENVQLHYVHGSIFLIFLIKGWPRSIHYEIMFKAKNVIIALHVESVFRASLTMMSTLQILESSLKELLPQYKLSSRPNVLSLEIPGDENDAHMINLLMNMLYEKTYPKMNAVLRGSEL